MTEDDFAYFNRRAGEEMAAAINARSVVAARIHRDLAERLRCRAEQLRPAPAQIETVDAA
jgi:hypothetical protein